MDPPSRFDPVEVPANTAHILRATRLWDEESALPAAEHPGITPVVRGRYTAGTVGGHEVPDYAREKDVDPERETETFVQVTLEAVSYTHLDVYKRQVHSQGAPPIDESSLHGQPVATHDIVGPHPCSAQTPPTQGWVRDGVWGLPLGVRPCRGGQDQVEITGGAFPPPSPPTLIPWTTSGPL